MKRFLNNAYVLFLAGVACFFMRSPVFAVTPTPYPRVTGGTITVDAALTTGANTITGLKFIDNADANYYLDPSGAISLVVDGTVGIGTTEPAYLLDVYTNTAAEEGIGIKNANSGGGATLVLRTNAIGTVMGLIANGSAYTTYGGANSLNIYQGNNAPIAFLTNGNSTPRMVISGAGLVGIGTRGPLSKLSVGGAGDASYAIYGNGTYGVYGNGGTGGKGVVGNVATSGYGLYGSANSDNGYAVFATNPSGYGVYSSGGTFDFYAANTRGKSYFAGSVGIGTTGPATALDVAGTITAAAFGLAFETRTAECSTAGCTATAACTSGKNVVFGTKASNTNLCDNNPSKCNMYCTVGTNSCAQIENSASDQASVYIVCAKIN